MNRRQILIFGLTLVCTAFVANSVYRSFRKSTVEVVFASNDLHLNKPAVTPPRQADGRHHFDLDDLWSLVSLSDAQISPDGRTVLVVVARANPAENRYDKSLAAIDVATRESRTVSELRGVSSPRWSPRGDRLVFLAHDDKSGYPQVFLLPLRGEARCVTFFPRGVEQLAFSPDGESLAVIAEDPPAVLEGVERFNDSFEVGHDNYLTTMPPNSLHLWVVPLSGNEPRRLTTGPGSLGTSMGVSPIGWSPDGRLIVVTRTTSAHTGDADQSHIEAVDVATGAVRRLTGRSAFESSPTVSPEGRRVAYLFPREGDPAAAIDVRVTSLVGGLDQRMASALDRSFLWNVWSPDGKLLLGANDLTKMRLWVAGASGEPRQLDIGSIAEITDLSVGTDGTVVLIGSEPQRPPEVYLMSLKDGGPPRRLTDLNAATTRVALGRTERVEWTSEDHIWADGERYLNGVSRTI